jgi:hypothetical protein
MRIPVKRLVIASVAAGGLALGLLAGSASPGAVTAASARTSSHATAHAAAAKLMRCFKDNDGDCWRPNYAIWRTDGSLDIWTGPGPGFGTDTGQSAGGNGTQVEVDCQTSGGTVDGLPYRIWDHLDDGGYVYDYYITTPAPNGQYSIPPLVHC